MLIFHLAYVLVVLTVSGLISGCGCQGGLIRHSWHAPPVLSTPPSAGVRQEGEKKNLPSALFGCRDCGYKSKNTNTDPQEGFAIHCSTSRVFCRAFLIHKAAACKWAKTSPKSWRSKRHQHSSCAMSLLGLWAVRCVWHQQTWLKMLKRMSVAYFELVTEAICACAELNFLKHSRWWQISSLMTQTLGSY